MSTDLVNWVSGRLDDSDLDDHAGLVILAALEGDAELDDCLATGTTNARPGEESSTKGFAPATVPGGVFLRSINVAGFRGIGQAAKVAFMPSPGLTIIAGRNGSGKSSFAEAFEFVLTGGTYRWKQKSAQWKEHWRNLHHGDPAAITVEVVDQNSGLVTITTRWDADAATVDDRSTKSQRAGQKQQDGMAPLGWELSLDRFRPILSYDELGGLLEGGPSELYDALANVLGVGQLGDALKRIQARLKVRKAPGDAGTRSRRELQVRASELEDERAAEAAQLLKKTAPDVDKLRSLATGVAVVDRGPLPSLRALCALNAPADADEAKGAAVRLRQVVASLADAGADASARRIARLELLEGALLAHQKHGDMPCPVCRTGRLDESWAVTSRQLAADERKEFRHVDVARQSLQVALAHARNLLPSRPAQLDRSPLFDLEVPVAAARAAWDAWATAPQGSDATTAHKLADHLELHVDDLTARLTELRHAASEQLSALDDAWEPLASAIAAWCNGWDAWLKVKPSVDLLAAAEKWLKDNDLRLKNERLAPIESGAREAWAKLRQESNVELGTLSLTGSGTQRRVLIDSTVDGTSAGSIAVLSQGELHALALALFLPRATMAESPFRFLILDDPVQAMDPAKVDGLVELLSALAKSRQIIVLSHDDRLPAAVRRAEIGATILEVTRGKHSRVAVRKGEDPAARYLADAYAMVKDESLPEQSLRKTLPGILRMAVESAARERYFTTRLKAGIALLDVESAWNSAATTRDRVSLAIYDEVRPLDNWTAPPYRLNGLRNVGTAMHNGLKEHISPDNAVYDVKRLVQDVRSGTK